MTERHATPRTAVVIGAGARLGRELALELARLGYSLALVDDGEDMDDTVEAAVEASGDAAPFKVSSHYANRGWRRLDVSAIVRDVHAQHAAVALVLLVLERNYPGIGGTVGDDAKRSLAKALVMYHYRDGSSLTGEPLSLISVIPPYKTGAMVVSENERAMRWERFTRILNEDSRVNLHRRVRCTTCVVGRLEDDDQSVALRGVKGRDGEIAPTWWRMGPHVLKRACALDEQSTREIFEGERELRIYPPFSPTNPDDDPSLMSSPDHASPSTPRRASLAPFASSPTRRRGSSVTEVVTSVIRKTLRRKKSVHRNLMGEIEIEETEGEIGEEEKQEERVEPNGASTSMSSPVRTPTTSDDAAGTIVSGARAVAPAPPGELPAAPNSHQHHSAHPCEYLTCAEASAWIVRDCLLRDHFLLHASGPMSTPTRDSNDTGYYFIGYDAWLFSLLFPRENDLLRLNVHTARLPTDVFLTGSTPSALPHLSPTSKAFARAQADYEAARQRNLAVRDLLLVVGCVAFANVFLGYTLITAPVLLFIVIAIGETRRGSPSSRDASTIFDLSWRLYLFEFLLALMRLRRLKVVKWGGESLGYAWRQGIEGSGIGTVLPRMRSYIRKSLL